MTIDAQDLNRLVESVDDYSRPSEQDGGFVSGQLIGMPLLKFELMAAADNPERTRAFFQKKHACYARFGASAASVQLEDSDLDHVHLVVATEIASGTIVGGIAIYHYHPSTTLPMERSIGHLDVMRPVIASWPGRAIVEFSALWADESWRKTGISAQLMLIAFAAAHVLGAEQIVGFGHHHLLDFYGTMGLRAQRPLKQFRYPNPDYLSTVLEGDSVELSTLPPENQCKVRDFISQLAEGRAIVWAGDKAILAVAS